MCRRRASSVSNKSGLISLIPVRPPILSFFTLGQESLKGHAVIKSRRTKRQNKSAYVLQSKDVNTIQSTDQWSPIKRMIHYHVYIRPITTELEDSLFLEVMRFQIDHHPQSVSQYLLLDSRMLSTHVSVWALRKLQTVTCADICSSAPLQRWSVKATSTAALNDAIFQRLYGSWKNSMNLS